MRPVEAGMCRFESLLDGTLELEHLQAMNDALDVRAFNQNRLASLQSQRMRP